MAIDNIQYLGTPDTNGPSRYTRYYHSWSNAAADHSARSNDRTVADGNPREDAGSGANPNVGTDNDRGRRTRLLVDATGCSDAMIVVSNKASGCNKGMIANRDGLQHIDLATHPKRRVMPNLDQRIVIGDLYPNVSFESYALTEGEEPWPVDLAAPGNRNPAVHFSTQQRPSARTNIALPDG